MPKPKDVIESLWNEAEAEARKSYPGYENSSDEAKRTAYWGTVHKIYKAKVRAHGRASKAVVVTTYKVGE